MNMVLVQTRLEASKTVRNCFIGCYILSSRARNISSYVHVLYVHMYMYYMEHILHMYYMQHIFICACTIWSIDYTCTIWSTSSYVHVLYGEQTTYVLYGTYPHIYYMEHRLPISSIDYILCTIWNISSYVLYGAYPHMYYMEHILICTIWSIDYLYQAQTTYVLYVTAYITQQMTKPEFYPLNTLNVYTVIDLRQPR